MHPTINARPNRCPSVSGVDFPSPGGGPYKAPSVSRIPIPESRTQTPSSQCERFPVVTGGVFVPYEVRRGGADSIFRRRLDEGMNAFAVLHCHRDGVHHAGTGRLRGENRMANTDTGSGHAASGAKPDTVREVPASVRGEPHGHTPPTSAKRARRRKSPLQKLREAEAAVEVERANAEKYLRRLGDIRDRRFGVGLRDPTLRGPALRCSSQDVFCCKDWRGRANFQIIR